jgi:hypothetical protein
LNILVFQFPDVCDRILALGMGSENIPSGNIAASASKPEKIVIGKFEELFN